MIIDRSKLIASNGNRLTQGLFVEYAFQYPDQPGKALYSLLREDKEFEGKVYPSLYRLYMETDDYTEAKFVQLYMHDLKQWEMLCASGWFKDEITAWREEMRHRHFSEMVNLLEKDARSKSKTSTASAKYLLDKVYGRAKGAGRPKNTKSDEPARVTRDALEVIEGDYGRLFSKKETA